MKKILVFRGGAVVQDDKSMNTFDINGEKPVDEVPANEKNIKKYMQDHKFPKAKGK